MSGGQDIIFTRLYDLLNDGPWPQDIAGRAYRNRLVRKRQGRDSRVLRRREELASDVAATRTCHDSELSSSIWARALDKSTPAAAEVVASTCREAEDILADRPSKCQRLLVSDGC